MIIKVGFSGRSEDDQLWRMQGQAPLRNGLDFAPIFWRVHTSTPRHFIAIIIAFASIVVEWLAKNLTFTSGGI